MALPPADSLCSFLVSPAATSALPASGHVFDLTSGLLRAPSRLLLFAPDDVYIGPHTYRRGSLEEASRYHRTQTCLLKSMRRFLGHGSAQSDGKLPGEDRIAITASADGTGTGTLFVSQVSSNVDSQEVSRTELSQVYCAEDPQVE